MPGVEKAALSSLYTAAQMELKTLFALGVLAGPDLDLIEKVLRDPTELTSIGRDPGQYRAGIDVVRNMINAKKSGIHDIYGTKPKSTESGPINLPTLPSKSSLKKGQLYKTPKGAFRWNGSKMVTP